MQVSVLIALLAIGVFSISLAACSDNPTSPSDLLLARYDFPTEDVIEIIKAPEATENDKPAVQVELKTPGFTILESLVLFKTSDLALEILASINQDHEALGIVSVAVEGFDNSSGVIVKNLDGQQASTVFSSKAVPS